MAENCVCKTKKRSDAEKKKLNNRLNRISGQIRGIQNMLESDAYCIDILTQVSAVSAALSSFGKELMKNHIQTCVVQDIKQDKNETVDELITVLEKFM